MAHLHAAGVAHRDLKLENFALNADLQPILIDYGLAVYLGRYLDAQTENVGTVCYRAPEIISRAGTDYTYDPFKADVFALAVVALCLLYKSYPWGYDEQTGLPRDAVEFVQGVGLQLNPLYEDFMQKWS